MSKEITKNEFLHLVALMHMAEQHYSKLKEYEQAAMDLLEDEDFVSDAIYGYEDFSAENLLNKMNIKIMEQ